MNKGVGSRDSDTSARNIGIVLSVMPTARSQSVCPRSRRDPWGWRENWDGVQTGSGKMELHDTQCKETIDKKQSKNTNPIVPACNTLTTGKANAGELPPQWLSDTQFPSFLHREGLLILYQIPLRPRRRWLVPHELGAESLERANKSPVQTPDRMETAVHQIAIMEMRRRRPHHKTACNGAPGETHCQQDSIPRIAQTESQHLINGGHTICHEKVLRVGFEPVDTRVVWCAAMIATTHTLTSIRHMVCMYMV